MSLRLVLILLALIAFFLATVGAAIPHVNLMGLGLFFLTASMLV